MLRKGVIPPRGWHYPSDNPDEPIRGYDLINLADKITEYRLANNIPVGSPESDIENYVCTTWPHYCGIKTEAKPSNSEVKRKDSRQAVNDRLLSWANSRLLRKHELADQNTAEARAVICAACPKNLPIKNQCGPCVKERNRKTTLLTEGKKVSVSLGYCQSIMQINSAAVFLAKEALRFPDKETLPSQCWMLPMYEDQTN